MIFCLLPYINWQWFSSILLIDVPVVSSRSRCVSCQCRYSVCWLHYIHKACVLSLYSSSMLQYLALGLIIASLFYGYVCCQCVYWICLFVFSLGMFVDSFFHGYVCFLSTRRVYIMSVHAIICIVYRYNRCQYICPLCLLLVYLSGTCMFLTVYAIDTTYLCSYANLLNMRGVEHFSNLNTIVVNVCCHFINQKLFALHIFPPFFCQIEIMHTFYDHKFVVEYLFLINVCRKQTRKR